MVGATTPAVGALQEVDTPVYFNHKSWSGVDNYAVYKYLKPLAGSEAVGSIYKRIPWDRLDVASVGIMVHGDLYPLKLDTGEYFLVVTDFAGTDYNRGAHIEINEPGTSGFEEYGASFTKHIYRAMLADTQEVEITFIVQASSAEAAREKVEETLSAGAEVSAPIRVVKLKAGVDYTIDRVEELMSSTSTVKTYGVVVRFHNYVYRVSVEYEGSLIRTLHLDCQREFCPLSINPRIMSQEETTPTSLYDRTYTREFDLSSGPMFFVGYKGTNGVKTEELPIVFEQEAR